MAHLGVSSDPLHHSYSYTNHCYKLVSCHEVEEQGEDGLETVQYVTIKNPHNSAQVRAMHFAWSVGVK